MGIGASIDKEYSSFINGERDENGFLILNVENVIDDNLEKMGSTEKTKFWVEFSDGTKALIKVGDEKDTLGHYAELIVEKLANQVGLEHAENDLVICNGKKGIISKSIIEKDEELYTLDSMTKTDNSIGQEEYADMCDLYSICKEFITTMKENGLEREEIEGLLEDFQKQMVFDLFIMGEDTHMENVSLVKKRGTNEYRISPIYDSESSLMLDREGEILKKLAEAFDFKYIKDATRDICPKIALVPEMQRECKGEDIYKYTFSQYIEDDEVGDFAFDCCENLNIKEAIDDVEKKIGRELPEEVKINAIIGFNFRKQELDKVMELGYDPMEEEMVI